MHPVSNYVVSQYVSILLFASALTVGPSSLEGAEAKFDRLAIIDKAIEFHGGAIYRSSETELDMCSKSGCFHIRASRDGGLFELEVAGRSGDSHQRVKWSNDRLEVWRNQQPVEIEPSKRQKYMDWVSARTYFPFLPFGLNDPSVYKSDLGLESWQGRELHKIKVTFEPGSSTDASDEYMYWLDPETGRVEQFAYSFEGNPGGLRFRRAENHRRIGGLLFFDQENLGASSDELRVDHITPDFVEKRMRAISKVELKHIEVRALP